MKTFALVAAIFLASCAVVQPAVVEVSVSPLRAGQKTIPTPVTWTLGPDRQATAETIVWLYEKDRGSSYTGSALRDGEVVVLCFEPLEARPEPADVLAATEAYHVNILFRLVGVVAIPSETRVSECKR